MKTSRLIALLLLGSFSTAAHADLVLDLSYVDSTTSKTISSGDVLFVDMFLIDTDGSTSMSSVGLISGGGRIEQTAGSATVTDNAATIAGPGLGWFNPSLNSPAVPGVTSVLVASQLPNTVGAGLTKIHIARFSLTATGSIGDMATLTSNVLGGTFTGNTTGPFAFEDLDAVLAGSPVPQYGSVDIVIVPEPTSFAFVLVSCGACMIRGRRRSA